ncbi:hypothetical protein [Sinomonas sp. G460-2]|uniref:hypothetical protein n=1 Tax=Sinomonas sp. G460-2 TaxID=3393464 RepID=UPI0039F0A5EA
MTAELPRKTLPDDPSRGEILTSLVIGAQTWIHRRVDSFTLGAGGTTRRSMSFDLTIPPDFTLLGPKDQVLVPLALIEKGALRRVDTDDPDRHPMPVLGAAENSRLTAELLAFLLEPAAPGLGFPSSRLRLLLDRLVAFRPGIDSDADRAHIVAELDNAIRDAWPDPDGEQAEVAALAEHIARGFLDHFLLVVAVSSDLVGRRVVLKFGYDREVGAPDWGNRVGAIRFSLPDVGLSRSQHVEFEAPPGLKVVELDVAETFREHPTGNGGVDHPAEQRAVAHVAFTPTRPLSGAEARVEVAPVGSGIYSFTVVAVLAVLAFSGLIINERQPGVQLVSLDFHVPSQSVSLLLIGPALFLSWMARAPEHRALAALLAPLRLMLAVCTLALLLAGVAVAVPLERWVWDTIWALVPILGIVNSIGLLLYSVNAPGFVRALFERRSAP